MYKEQAEMAVNEIFSLYKIYGKADYIGEPVSQLEHMCQATQLAESEGYDDEAILAAFFHDIGHLCEHIMETRPMDQYGVADHEGIAGFYLRSKGFSDKIVSMVQNHVQAKRYLAAKQPGYYEKLSIASQHTLTLQGGLMSDEEVRAFESDPHFAASIKLREWDDQAKQENLPLPSLDKYKEMALRHLLGQSQ